MTRGQITKRVIQILGLDDTVGGEEVTLVHDLINEAILDISRRTKVNMRILDIHLSAGTNAFEIPAGVLLMMDLRKMGTDPSNSNGVEMTQKLASEVEMDVSGLSYSIVGYDTLLVSGGFDAARDYKAWYVPKPQPMTDDAHDPSTEIYGGIPEEFHYTAILNYVLWNGADYGDDITSQSGERYRILYEGENGLGGNLGDIKRTTNKRATPAGRRGRIQDGYASHDYITTGGW
jgi:hypothetical protein